MPIYVSTAICSILTHLLLMRISRAVTPGLLDVQHGALQGRNTTTLATKLLNDLHSQDGYVALLDVAKAFPSVPQPMPPGIVKEAGAPEIIIRMLGEIYEHTPVVLSLHGRDLPIRPTRGLKEGCPVSPTLFLLYYEILLRDTNERCPEDHLYVFVDDIAVRAPTTDSLLHSLDTLHEVGHTMGLRCNKEKNVLSGQLLPHLEGCIKLDDTHVKVGQPVHDIAHPCCHIVANFITCRNAVLASNHPQGSH